ncbi:Panacea domain-containing protein [Halobacillus mangrovi]|uniref:Panacea domain-containing protein n=1 Tax=Halobacillus mangrovi TaxID=402384 RepID=UPI003D973D05
MDYVVTRPIQVTDVANMLLSISPMTHKKLQKLSYYTYAWYYTLFGEEPFEENFQAWVHGPVSPELYRKYKEHGWQEIHQSEIDPQLIEENPALWNFVNFVYESYGHLNADELEFLTHQEAPWLEARGELDELEPCETVINRTTIRNYYQTVFEHDQQE